MKLFHNFDSNSSKKNYDIAIAEFGIDKVYMVEKHSYYILVYIIAPAISILLLCIYSIYMWYIWYIMVVIAMVSLAVYMLISLWYNYFNYKYDYIIVTPRYIISYDQTSLFTNTIHTFESTEVLKIDVETPTLLSGILDYWNLRITIEWDEKNNTIFVDYIKSPIITKDRIESLLSYIW